MGCAGEYRDGGPGDEGERWAELWDEKCMGVELASGTGMRGQVLECEYELGGVFLRLETTFDTLLRTVLCV